MPKCTRCDDIGWVCENHTDKPWHMGAGGCMCGAGAPCPACNVANADNPPRDPSDFVRVEIKPMSEQAQEYLRLAKDAEAKAKTTTNPVARKSYEATAANWRRLADFVDPVWKLH